MILGMGIDIVDIRRIERSLARFGTRFEQRIFTPGEQAKAQSRKGGAHNSMAGTYAKRYAAKEAFSKAVGTGFQQGVFMRDIEVVNAPSGKPTLSLSGGAAQTLARIVPTGKTAVIHLTLTDEHPYAQAQIIIEAI